MGGLILGVNTLYRLFCFFKLFPMVGKGLKHGTESLDPICPMASRTCPMVEVGYVLWQVGHVLSRTCPMVGHVLWYK